MCVHAYMCFCDVFISSQCNMCVRLVWMCMNAWAFAFARAYARPVSMHYLCE